MFFRPHPLTEAAVIYAVSGLLSVLSFLAVTGGNIPEVFGLGQVQAMFVMLPGFFLWSVVGFFLKNRGYLARFIGAAVVTVVVALVGVALFQQYADLLAVNSAADASVFVNLRMIPILSTFVINSLIGCAFCQFWLVRRYEA